MIIILDNSKVYNTIYIYIYIYELDNSPGCSFMINIKLPFKATYSTHHNI